MNSTLEHVGLIEQTSKNREFKLKDVHIPFSDSTSLSKNPEKWWQRIPKRYILSLISFFGFFNVYALRINLSVAIIAMVRQKNGNETSSFNNFDWDTKQQGMLLSSFFWGYVVTQIPRGLLATRYGPKKFFGGGVLTTSILTLIFPIIAHNCSFKVVVFLRILEGLFEGVTYPSMYALWSHWAPPLERSKLLTISFSGSYVGAVVSMLLSGLIAEAFGWEAIFYFFGSIGVLWYILWSWVVTETPEDHSTIGDDELNYIVSSKGGYDQNITLSNVPWKSIFTSTPVWAIIVAHFVGNWGRYTLLTELPTYMHDTLKLNIDKIGMLSALPYFLMAINVQLGGQIADFLRRNGYLTTTKVRKLFTAIGFLGQSIFLLLTAYSTDKANAVTFLTLAVCINGFEYSGFHVNHLDISPTYAGILMGITNTAGTMPGMISPSITGLLVQHKTQEEWKVVFLIVVAIYIFGCVIYSIFSSGEMKHWSPEDNQIRP